MKTSLIIATILATGHLATAQVTIIRGGEQSAPTGEKSTVTIQTGDRTITPATVDTKETKTATGKQTETVTRLRDADGKYFEWQRAANVTREVAPGQTERTSEITERDRQGGTRTRSLVKETTTKTDAGERTATAEYRRDVSGNLVMAHDISATTAKRADGSSSQTSTENDYDINGRPVVTRQTESATQLNKDGTTTTTSTTKSIDHLNGGIGATVREVAAVRADGNTTRIETVTQKPSGNSWINDSRTVTVETKAADGSVQRETITEGRSLFDRQSGSHMDTGNLVPQTKIVEHEVRQPDGNTVIQRDQYRRDVNGDWKATSFSTEAANVGK